MRSLFVLALVIFIPAPAGAVTIPTVFVGDQGNAAELSGYGSGGSGPLGLVGAVGYTYRIATTEVTNAQYVEFLNAVAATDTYQLYDYAMGDWSQGGITRSGSPGSYIYAVKDDAVGMGPGGSNYSYSNKPVNFVSWGDAARFANWLHNGQPSGPQGNATTENGAYTLNGAMTNDELIAVSRNSNAQWVIPSEHEWYKAAYYDRSSQTYYDYPTGSNTAPDTNLPTSDSGNSANYDDTAYGNGLTAPYDYPFTDVGAYAGSASPYGTFDQAGNAEEWMESVESLRGVRGGVLGRNLIHANTRTYALADFGGTYSGFRMAFIPEPSTYALGAIGLAALLWSRRRRFTS